MKSHNYLSFLLAIIAFSMGAPKLALAESDKPETALVSSLFKTYGGREYIRNLHGMRLHFAGEIFNPWQSRSTTEATPISASHRYMFDWDGQREAADTDFNFPGGHRVHMLEIKKTTQSLVADITSKSVAVSSNHFRLPAAIRFHPILILRELAREDVNIRNSGSIRIQGSTFDVLSTSRNGGPSLDILLTQGVVRIGGVRYKSWAADNEHATAVQLFSGGEGNASYMPSIITGYIDSVHAQKWQYTIEQMTLNPTFAQEEFNEPSGFLKSSDVTQSSIIELGKGIHLVRGLQNDDYNALIIEFEKYLTIVEAPIDHNAGEELRRVAKRIAPTKPIKYLVLTHHHADHIGGASALIEQDTEIIAPTSSRPYIEAIISARKMPFKYAFRGLEKNTNLSIGDGALRLDIFALHGNPHADDMLFVYVPESKLVFQADMFFFQDPDCLSYPLNERGFAFYHSLLLLGLDFTKVAGTHGVPVTRQRAEKFVRNPLLAIPR